MGKVELMHKHLASKCPTVAEDVKNWAQEQMPKKDTPKRPLPTSSPQSESSPPSKSGTQATFVLNSMPRVSPEEQAALRTQLMRFIASANIPFVVVDNVEFQKFCTMMRGPTFHLPDRHTISDGLLPQLYGALESKFRHVTKGRNATMAMDGWSDAKNDPTLGYGVTVISTQTWSRLVVCS